MGKTRNPGALTKAVLGLPDDVRLLWGLCKDRRVSPWSKAFLGIGLAYIISPVDVIPDVIPGVGRLDDLTIAMLWVKAFERMCPANIVREHRVRISRGMADLDRDLDRLKHTAGKGLSRTLKAITPGP